MPVTIKPATHESNIVTSQQFAIDATEILSGVSERRELQHLELLQSSWGEDDLPQDIKQQNNGFVRACIDAYSSHQHLILRPEDIWVAVLTQFFAYVKNNAEELRKSFVAHENIGKRHMEIAYPSGDRYSVDFTRVALMMGGGLENNLVDPKYRQWILPDFSTTTETDRAVVSILMMGNMQKYFSYGMKISCGLPSVTLLGERSDWELLMTKLEKLASFGDEPSQFAGLLRPIMTRFIKSFEDPSLPEVIDFWQQITSEGLQESGNEYFSGWITAFCFWDEDGRCIYRLGHNPLTIDGISYAEIDTRCIPSGYSKVPFHMYENGNRFTAQVFAGSAGYSCLSSGQMTASGEVGLDVIQPELGWWLFQDNGQEVDG